ncbi:MAG: DoxX family protein [Hyphomicrobiaceae bacterium]|nr:MAG: DoxX family protein [Hyphomicrobiaceae bacterium]
MNTSQDNALRASTRRRFGLALLILRVALGVFLLVFGLEKFIAPSTSVAIYQYLYGVSAPVALVYALGALEILLAIAIIVGAFRRWSYAIGLLAHGATVMATARLIIDPWGLISGEPQHLYLAAVPVLAAFAALYLLRDLDCFSLDQWRASSSSRVPARA